MESGELDYITVGKFLVDLKKEFRKEDNKAIKIANLKKVEEESRTVKEFM